MNTKSPETASESDAIRSDIEQTRESMDRTLDEIGDRMRPRHLLDAALDLVRSYSPEGKVITEKAGLAAKTAGDAASRAVNNVINVVRQHPVPTLLIGAGITLAIIESRRSRGNGIPGNGNGGGEYHDELSGQFEEGAPEGALGIAKEKISTAGEKIQSEIKATGGKLKEKTQRLGQRVSEGARTVGKKAGEMVTQRYEAGRARFVATRDAHPLSLGVGFLAAGMLVGLALPPTRREDQLVGDMADQAKDAAKAKAQDLMERGKQVASAAAQAAKETATQQGLVSSETSGPGTPGIK